MSGGEKETSKQLLSDPRHPPAGRSTRSELGQKITVGHFVTIRIPTPNENVVRNINNQGMGMESLWTLSPSKHRLSNWFKLWFLKDFQLTTSQWNQWMVYQMSERFCKLTDTQNKINISVIQILEKSLITFSDCLVYSEKCYQKRSRRWPFEGFLLIYVRAPWWTMWWRMVN